MKRIAIVLSIMMLTFGLMAQEGGNTPAQTKQKLEDKVQSGSRDRLVIEVGFVNWAQLDGKAANVKWHSMYYNFYFMYDMIIKKSRFSFAPGIGFGIENLATDKTLFQDTASTSFLAFENNPNYAGKEGFKKHKINTTYLDIPLELRFRAKPNAKNQSFKMALGFKGGIKIDNFSKVWYEERGRKRSIKTKNYADVMLFRFGPTFRIGYGAFNVTAFYNLNDYFNSNGPSNVHPFNVGISINGL